VGDRLVEWYGPPRPGPTRNPDPDPGFYALAERLGVAPDTLGKRRRTAYRWPVGRRGTR
jgi:hypothetical protein